MITEIGIIAGEMWQYLDKYNETTLSNLIDVTGKKRDLVFMSIGWLAREGHIVLKKEGEDCKITLREKDSK